MKLSLEAAYVLVDDMERGVDFYRKLLDREPEAKTDSFSSFRIGAFSLLLFRPSPSEEVEEANCVLTLKAGNVEEAHAMVQSLNVDMWPTPIEQEGYRLFQFKDTEGNVLEIYEEQGHATEST